MVNTTLNERRWNDQLARLRSTRTLPLAAREQVGALLESPERADRLDGVDRTVRTVWFARDVLRAFLPMETDELVRGSIQGHLNK